MTILIQALSSISRSSTGMSPNITSTHCPTTSDTELLPSANLLKHHDQVTEIATRPNFYVFTSLLWTRVRNSDSDITNWLNQLEKRGTLQAETIQITILRKDQPDLGLLRYHRDRLAAAADALLWPKIRALDASDKGMSILRSSIAMYVRCLPELASDRIERRKLRIMISRTGSISVDSTIIDHLYLHDHNYLIDTFLPRSFELAVPGSLKIELNGDVIRDENLCQVDLDTQSSRPSPFTTHKTSYRTQYDTARLRAGIATFPPTQKEVLLYNRDGEVMEASLCTVYFFRNGQWITPAAICGGNLGVTRRMALESDLCKQGSIDVTELEDGEKIWLSNGARGFFVGQLCLQTKP